MDKLIEFEKIRFKEPGAYVSIPKNIMEEMKLEVGKVIKITFVNCLTYNGEYDVVNTIQRPSTIYLRKLDLRMIGLTDKKGNLMAEKDSDGRVIIPRLKGYIVVL